MVSRLKSASLRSLDLGAVDLRRFAEPLAVLSPIALVVGCQEVVMTLVALLFVWRSWRANDFSWIRQGWFAALAALWAYALLRTAVNHPTATGVLFALHWIHFPIYAAALAHWILPDEKSRDRLLLASAAALTFYGLDCLLQYVFGFDIIGRPAWNSRLTSVSRKPGVGIEIAWLMAAPVLGFWQKGRRAFAIFLGLLCVVAVLLSGDRMGLLIVLGTAVLLGLLAPGLRRPVLIGLPAIAALLGAILYFSPTMYHRQIDTTVETIAHLDQSPYGIVFKSALDIARDHPIFGVGVHNYQAVCLEPQYGPPTVGADETPRCLGHPHNLYLQWLTEGGLIGLGLYLVFVVLSLRTLALAMARNRGDLVFYGLAASLALRFWPLAAGTGFFSSWAAEPLFLVLGWSLAYCGPTELPAPAADDGRPSSGRA